MQEMGRGETPVRRQLGSWAPNGREETPGPGRRGRLPEAFPPAEAGGGMWSQVPGVTVLQSLPNTARLA